LGCSAGLCAGKSEGPDPVLPTPGKANTGFAVEVLLVVEGVGWFVGIGNVGTDVAVVLEVTVVDCGGTAGLEKKLGTVVPAAVVEGSDFMVGVGKVVVAGLAKKLGTAGCAGTGTVLEDVGVGVGAMKMFFVGSLVSIVVEFVGGFVCVEVIEAGVDKVGVVMLMVEVMIAGAEEGFFSCSAAFFVS
jgi:hypothetical protein